MFCSQNSQQIDIGSCGESCNTALWQALKIRGFFSDFPGAIFRVEEAKKKVFVELTQSGYFKEIWLVRKQEHFDGYTNFIYMDSQHLFCYNYNFENSTEQKISIRWS